MKLSHKGPVAAASAVATIASIAFTPAVAESVSIGETCKLEDGLARGVADARAEIFACQRALPDRVTALDDTEADLLVRTNAVRESANANALIRTAALDRTARLHAADMAVRGWVGHVDPDGRDLTQRIALADPLGLYGAMGANVVVLPKDADATAVFDALASDPVNVANMQRTAFSDVGLAIVKTDELIFAVQVFARNEGELKRNIPDTLDRTALLDAAFNETGWSIASWTLVGSDGTPLDSGLTSRITARTSARPAQIVLNVTDGQSSWQVKGPATEG